MARAGVPRSAARARLPPQQEPTPQLAPERERTSGRRLRHPRRAVALLLALLLTTFDLSINHFWSGFRYNDNIRYYFFEDLSIIGGLLLLATAGGGELSLDACRGAAG